MKRFAEVLARKKFLGQISHFTDGESEAQNCYLFAKGSTGCERSEAGVWVPTSMAMFSPALLSLSVQQAFDGGNESRVFTVLARPIIIDKWMALWLPKLFFLFPVPLLCWKANLSRTCARTHRNVQNP